MCVRAPNVSHRSPREKSASREVELLRSSSSRHHDNCVTRKHFAAWGRTCGRERAHSSFTEWAGVLVKGLVLLIRFADSIELEVPLSKVFDHMSRHVRCMGLIRVFLCFDIRISCVVSFFLALILLSSFHASLWPVCLCV